MDKSDQPKDDLNSASLASRDGSDGSPTLGESRGLGASGALDGDVTLDSPAAVMGAPERGGVEPRSIGPYRLIKKIGEGGMGQVWLAQQSAPLERKVALKLIRVGMYDDDVLKRFASERQALANMNHPAIAKVFDAGATADGQPYFVMEYVQGLPISDYCDEKRLKIRERLELFIEVCEGVQHAHQKAIMHRDLKPANILVVKVDGKARPRIIDFGLAKAATSRPGGEGAFTQVRGWVGTPGYMSPEQADPGVLDVDTRTDVYSLGVILYELLTGALPFDPKLWKTKPFDEALRHLREDETDRPSTKVSSDRRGATSAALNRGTESQPLVKLLRGDLDWITMKALEKDRARRYDSCSALVADVRRYLNSEAVLATPPSFGYRAGKFVRRHRVPVIASSAVAVLLVALAASMTLQAVRIARERDRANREAAAAKSVSEFLTGLFRVSDPSEARGNSITARQILDQGVKQVEAGLSGQPEVQARLMGTMGEVYWSLGLFKEAAPLLEKAVETRQRVLGPEHPDTLRSMYLVGKNLNDDGRYAEAEKLLREVLEAQRRVLGPEHPETVSSMIGIAGVIYEEGRYQEAEKLQRELLDMQRRAFAPDDRRALMAMNNLAVNLDTQGRYAEAEQLYREALELEHRTFGPDHPLTLQSMTNVARVLNNETKYADAERLLRETLDMQRRVLGSEHQDTLWSTQVLAESLRAEGHLLDAEKLQRETLSIRERVLGPEHPDTLGSMEVLAVTLDMLHRYPEAAELYRKAIDVQKRVLGPDHPATASSKYDLACNFALSGRRDQAVATLRDAVEHGLSARTASAIDKDSDFNSLHGDLRFEALVARAKGGAAPAQKSH